MGACNSHFPFKRHKGGKPNPSSPTGAHIAKDDDPSSDNITPPQLKSKQTGDCLHNGIPLEQFISVCDMYNILNDSGIRPFIHDPLKFLVLDVRAADDYTTNHIVTSYQHTAFMNDARSCDQLPNYAIIVLYGDELVDDDPSSSQSVLDALKRVEEYVACEIFILKDGFNAFSQRFSYLCTDQVVDSLDDRKLLLCYPSAVVDGLLYQGRGDQARNEVVMTTIGITHIVNISEHTNAFPHKIKYLRLPLDDMVSTNLSQHFHETFEFIHDALEDKGCVLIHCNLGISRSSTIMLAYLMKSRKWTLLQAYKLLKSVRVAASPNSGFLRQLSEWELEVLGEKHTQLDQIAKHNEYIVKTYGVKR